MAAIAPIREAVRPAPAADGSASAARVLAAVPQLLLRRRVPALGSGGERCRAGAVPDRKRYCRSARARAAQARSLRRPKRPRYRSEQWFETSRGFKANRARDIVQTCRPLAGQPVNTPNTAGKGRFCRLWEHWSARTADGIVGP